MGFSFSGKGILIRDGKKTVHNEPSFFAAIVVVITPQKAGLPLGEGAWQAETVKNIYKKLRNKMCNITIKLEGAT